jgi:hypothetical protein
MSFSPAMSASSDLGAPPAASAKAPRVRLLNAPWWASPVGITLGFLLPMLMLIAYVGASNFSGLTVRGISFLSADYIALGAGALLVVCLSSWIGSQIALAHEKIVRPKDYAWDRAAWVTGGAALLAYLIFFRGFLTHPLLLVQTLTGAYRPNRDNMELTAGITSFENFAPVFFSIYAYRVIRLRARVSRLQHALCGVLLFLTALRVYAWSERLALIEAGVPFALSVAARIGESRTRIAAWMARGGPYLVFPVFILYFSVAEYFRSWQSSTYNQLSGFWEFSLGRLASYYYTSLNNGAGILATSNWPDFRFAYTLEWLHRAPFIGPMFSHYVGLREKGTGQFLKKFGDPEFNNPSGIYTVLFDLGLPLGVIYFSLLGLAAGMAFRAYRAGSFVGVIGYPILFLTLLELFRYPYLGASRGFAWALGICVAAFIARPPRRRAPVATPAYGSTHLPDTRGLLQ